MVEATKEDRRAAKYNDEVNSVSFASSNLQYWFVPPTFSSSLRYTEGKNFSKNDGIEVTPPANNT
jgi:hypothetical protein